MSQDEILQAAHLLFRQRRLRVGVALAAGEHAPEQAGELARGGDDRDRVPASRTHALIEGGDALVASTYGHVLAEFAETDRIDAEAEIAKARGEACSLRVPTASI